MDHTQKWPALVRELAGFGPKVSRRKQVRARITRNRRRRELWLHFSHKKERERETLFDRQLHGVPRIWSASKFRAAKLHLYYGRDGWPISMRSFIWQKEYGRVHVALTHVAGEIWVSTVWLGTDHGYNVHEDAKYRPVIFESMLWGGPKHCAWCTRYRTTGEALEGHARMVERAQQCIERGSWDDDDDGDDVN